MGVTCNTDPNMFPESNAFPNSELIFKAYDNVSGAEKVERVSRVS